MGTATRYMLRRNTASIMMILSYLKFAFDGYHKLLTSTKPQTSTQGVVIVNSIALLVKSRR